MPTQHLKSFECWRALTIFLRVTGWTRALFPLPPALGPAGSPFGSRRNAFMAFRSNSDGLIPGSESETPDAPKNKRPPLGVVSLFLRMVGAMGFPPTPRNH